MTEEILTLYGANWCPDCRNSKQYLGEQGAQRFGVELLRATEVVGLRADGGCRYAQTADDKEYGARAVLVATGSTYRRLNVPGEDDFIGAGVHFCATCDGPFYKNQHIVVIGGGNSAAEESLFLTRFADKITILVRKDSMSASPLVVKKVLEHPKIEVRLNASATEFVGEGSLESIRFRDGTTDAMEQLNAAAVFVFIGLTPNTKWLPDEIERDEYGFIVTHRTLETSMPGVFAAGDLREGSTKQAASAAGEGATAALMIREYLNEH